MFATNVACPQVTLTLLYTRFRSPFLGLVCALIVEVSSSFFLNPAVIFSTFSIFLVISGLFNSVFLCRSVFYHTEIILEGKTLHTVIVAVSFFLNFYIFASNNFNTKTDKASPNRKRVNKLQFMMAISSLNCRERKCKFSLDFRFLLSE